MYSLFNNKIFSNVIVCALIVLMQAYSPQIFISNNINVSLDFLLILITFLVLLNKTFYIVFLGMLLGLLQDFIINVQAIGLYSFIKSLSVYYLGKIKLNNNLWTRNFKLIYILIIYFIHFLFYYTVINFDINLMILSLSFFHSILAIIMLCIFEKIFFNAELL